TVENDRAQTPESEQRSSHPETRGRRPLSLQDQMTEASERSNSRPHLKQTWYVLPLIVNTRLSWRCRHLKTNSKTHSSGFIRPALPGDRNFRWHRATPVAS